MYNPTFLQEENPYFTMQNLHLFAINLLCDKLSKSTGIIIFGGFGISKTFNHTVTVQNL